MFVIWFKKDGEWHWVEIFHEITADLTKEALKAQGYEVADTIMDPRKYSLIKQKEN